MGRGRTTRFRAAQQGMVGARIATPAALDILSRQPRVFSHSSPREVFIARAVTDPSRQEIMGRLLELPGDIFALHQALPWEAIVAASDERGIAKALKKEQKDKAITGTIVDVRARTQRMLDGSLRSLGVTLDIENAVNEPEGNGIIVDMPDIELTQDGMEVILGIEERLNGLSVALGAASIAEVTRRPQFL